MNIEKTMKNLEKNGYTVRFFQTGAEAVQYLEDTVQGKTIAAGSSQTVTELGLLEKLSAKNTLMTPNFGPPPEDHGKPEFGPPGEGPDGPGGPSGPPPMDIGKDADYFFLSANGLSEDGVIVNLDALGNRIGGSLLGHQKVYFIIGTNKIAETLEDTIWRVRNIASPKNAVRMHLNTPCAVKGDKCYDCDSFCPLA